MPPLMNTHSTFEWVAAFVIGCLAVARLTRLVVWDTYPPAARLRAWWDRVTDNGPWATLAHCGYCFGLWAAVPVVLWGWLSDLHWTWWLFCIWLAAGYIGAIVMAFDGED